MQKQLQPLFSGDITPDRVKRRVIKDYKEALSGTDLKVYITNVAWI